MWTEATLRSAVGRSEKPPNDRKMHLSDFQNIWEGDRKTQRVEQAYLARSRITTKYSDTQRQRLTTRGEID